MTSIHNEHEHADGVAALNVKSPEKYETQLISRIKNPFMHENLARYKMEASIGRADEYQ